MNWTKFRVLRKHDITNTFNAVFNDTNDRELFSVRRKVISNLKNRTYIDHRNHECAFRFLVGDTLSSYYTGCIYSEKFDYMDETNFCYEVDKMLRGLR